MEEKEYHVEGHDPSENVIEYDPKNDLRNPNANTNPNQNRGIESQPAPDGAKKISVEHISDFKHEEGKDMYSEFQKEQKTWEWENVAAYDDHRMGAQKIAKYVIAVILIGLMVFWVFSYY